MAETKRLMEDIGGRAIERFSRENAILTFADYLELLALRPYSLTRMAAQYVADAMLHFGTTDVPTLSGPMRRFKIFDDPTGDGTLHVVAQEEAQNEIYRALTEFTKRRQIDKLILLHGPNGSSKTTMVSALVRGLEAYSHLPDGMALRFNWIFSEGSETKEKLGFNPVRPGELLESFAHLDPERISAKIPCELKDNPFFLIPAEERRALLERLLAAAPESERSRFIWTRYLTEGDLSPKSKTIYNVLLTSYGGDWKKVIRHIQVQRWYVSRRFRDGAVTIEPQANIDAHSRQIGHSTMNGLPPVLQNESLFEAYGDLVDANCGIVEYSDFFKRPLEANKYLLTTAENGMIHLQSFTAYLNLLMIATGNEMYLTAFRRDAIFSSFKTRLALVRVPYLLQYQKEKAIYRRHLDALPPTIHRAPRIDEIVATWAVMTRLLPPVGDIGMDRIRRVIERLTPLEKAKLYDHGEVPNGLTDEEKTLLRSAVPALRREHDGVEAEFDGIFDAAYEGRRGCSPREMLAILFEIAQNPPGDCFGPLFFLRRIPELITDSSIYEFLRQKPTKHGYHDLETFATELQADLYAGIQRDIERASELVEEGEYGRLFKRYFLHLKAHETHEKILAEKTGKYVDPDMEFMARIERLLLVKQDVDSFRSSLMARAAAFKLSNPTKAIVYEDVFGELFKILRENIFREELQKVRRMVEDVLIVAGFVPGRIDQERIDVATRIRDRLLSPSYGYCRQCMGESLQFFLECSRTK
jgi:serine protein kinase